ncbi:MAG: phosphodiester glycosidase family protein, partial [Clostridia bacterium]|nr:phosphodiester glycosidase family protein [Clostridia bacterium]
SYCLAVGELYPNRDSAREQTLDEIIRRVQRVRREMLGTAPIEAARAARMDAPLSFDPADGIDQSAKKAAMTAAHGTVIAALFDASLFPLMAADLRTAAAQGGHIILLIGAPGDSLPPRETIGDRLADIPGLRFLEADADCPGGALAGIACDAQLQAAVDAGDACLLAYGEEAFLQCRGLTVEAIVSGRPGGYYTRALCNQLGIARDAVVYVPPRLDITDYVPLVGKTQLSYWHLATLARDHGDGIYDLTPAELYRRYPAYFLNRYENGKICAEASPDCPIHISLPESETDPIGRYDVYREEAIRDYLGSFEGVSYRSAYFDENLQEIPAPYGTTEKQQGILVHSVRVKRARGSRVMGCGGATPRQLFADLPARESGIASNFLFFLTGGLTSLYNRLREDRPHEQASLSRRHLDYMLTYDEQGRRTESFPLFRKTCIALKENGEFLFFNFRLGGGKITFGETALTWTAADVDPTEDAPAAPVCVYTPYLSCSDGDADRSTYRRAVGADRVNFVLMQDRILCVREGDVILPSIGVVVSLEAGYGRSVLTALGLAPIEDGYYSPDGLSMSVELDPPAGIPADEWATVRWAYGGGLSLILDGQAVSDREDMESWFAEEGWMSPLSRQTQESALHKLVKHPRTAIGAAENGDLLLLVFSGRTKLSSGADYREMCRITRALYPDVRSLMNGDGGGSAMLGLVCDGRFMELSCPSTSVGSCVGMVRPIQTVFFIAQDSPAQTL